MHYGDIKIMSVFHHTPKYFRKALELIERDFGHNQFYEMISKNLEMVEEQIR